MKHVDQVIALLKTEISNDQEVKEIGTTASAVVAKWVNPIGTGNEEINGLVYGLVQSGKTGVLTVTGAMGADEGYKVIVILTSDIDPLYDQTFRRIQQAFPGIDILGKNDFKDEATFTSRIKRGVCAIVTTKNAKLLDTLIENFKKGKMKAHSCLMIDDEADQASPNTKASKDDGSVSPINEKISDLRASFDRNTYLQVTATPQALFLQSPGHSFRPKFTVLSHPGHDYVGGEDFFADDSKLVREFNMTDIVALAAGSQPSPKMNMPKSLLRALDTFMVAATFKRKNEANQNCAFLCHVSTRNSDHKHIEDLFRHYKAELPAGLKAKSQSVIDRLKAAYDDLAATHGGLKAASFQQLVDAIEFFSPGITVKLVNGQTDEDVQCNTPYNLFVGGNKLGRGVTIKNLLVSYYGRNPKSPQSDTVLQHARMYGYRRKDFGLLRLFLPPELHTVFKAINRMEVSLRELIAKSPGEEFRGVYLEGRVKATRKSILAPGSIGVYSGGSGYNPAQVLRDASVIATTEKIDKSFAKVANKSTAKMTIAEMQSLIRLTMPDESKSERVWNPEAIAESLGQFAKLKKKTEGYVYVDRDRGLEQDRRETQGIIEGGEIKSVPDDEIAIFMLRTKPSPGKHAAWWPQMRFPKGAYAFAFAV